MVREWPEFESEFRSELELELEGGPADFSMMVVVSESEIISSESKIISSSSEVKRILVGDLSKEGGLSRDLLWGIWSISGFYCQRGNSIQRQRGWCGVLEGYEEWGSQSYEMIEG